MRIAVLHRYPPAQVIGTNASFIKFLEELKKRGHQVFYITYREPDMNVRLGGITFLRLPLAFERGSNRDKTRKTFLWILLVPIFTAYWSHKYHFDLIYGDDSVPIYPFLTKLLNPGRKVIMRLGDLQTGYALADDYPRSFRLVSFIEVAMWQRMDGLVAISIPFKDYIIRQGIPEKKVAVVEESIDLTADVINETHRPNKNEGITFLFHGAFVRCKGLSILVEAFARFQKSHPESRLILAGDGPEMKSIKMQVNRLGIKQVEFTGWYNLAQLPIIMAHSDVGVIMRSPNMANNFVVTTCLLENFKYKKPVLVPRLAAFGGVVTENWNGRYFTPGDAQDLARQMEAVLKSRNRWLVWTEHGLQTAKMLFDAQLIARKMARTIEIFASPS